MMKKRCVVIFTVVFIAGIVAGFASAEVVAQSYSYPYDQYWGSQSSNDGYGMYGGQQSYPYWQYSQIVQRPLYVQFPYYMPYPYAYTQYLYYCYPYYGQPGCYVQYPVYLTPYYFPQY